MSFFKTLNNSATRVLSAVGAVSFVIESAAMAGAKEMAKFEAQSGDVKDLSPEAQAEYAKIIARLAP